MSIDYEMRIDFSMFEAAIEAAVPIALERGGEHVRAVAVARTPNATGHLAGSAGVAVFGSGIDCYADVKYPGPYAAFQNRGMRADGTHVIRKRPAGGQTGFLTDTMIDQREPVLQIIADTIRQLA
jgi:hypothetical protein